MRPEDFLAAVRARLQTTGQSRHGAAVGNDLPRDAIRRTLDGRMPRLDRAIEICDALGLEFYVGPPRAGRPQPVESPGLSGAALADLERSTRDLVRLTAEAGGDPVPDDLWPVLAAGRDPGAENGHRPPGARPVEVVELRAAAGTGAETLDEEVVGCVWFRRDWLDARGLDPTRCAVIRVTGESMEPFLLDGDSLLVDRGRRDRLDRGVFVVRTADGLVVKRARLSARGAWLLISEHPTWKPAPWPDDAETIGQVVWMARTIGIEG